MYSNLHMRQPSCSVLLSHSLTKKNFPELAVNHGQSTYPHVRYRYDPAINKHSRPEAQCTPKPVAQARTKPVALIARGQLSMANHTLSAICSRRRAHYANRITIPFKASLVQHIAIIQVRSIAHGRRTTVGPCATNSPQQMPL